MREEILVLLVMAGVSIIGSVATRNDRKWAVAFLLIAAAAGSLAAGMGLRFREIVEGAFGFLDAALSVCAAAIFVKLLEDCGAFDALLERISRIKCGTLRAFGVLLFIALPAMFTGFATMSVVTTGRIAGKRMKERGASGASAAACVAAGAFIGMMLPPNCIPAIIAANGAGSVLPTPYTGFFLPLLVMSIPSFVIFALMEKKTLADVCGTEAAGEAGTMAELVIPAIVMLALLAEGVASSIVYLGGNTLIFAAGSAAVLIFAGKRLGGARAALESLSGGLEAAAPAAALMFAVGSFIEVSSMTGVRGIYSLFILPHSVPAVMLTLMALALILGTFLSVPLPSVLAAYAIFPIGWLANTVIVSGVSAALGLVWLVTLRGGLIDSVMSELQPQDVRHREVLAKTAVPAAVMLAAGTAMLLLGDKLSFLIV